MKRFIFALATAGALIGAQLSSGRAEAAPIGGPDGIRSAVHTFGLVDTVQHGPAIGHRSRGFGHRGGMMRGGGHRGGMMQGGGGHRGGMMRSGGGHRGGMMRGRGHRGGMMQGGGGHEGGRGGRF